MEANKEKIALLHIVSGIQIIGRVTVGDDVVTVDKPFQVITVRAPNGQLVGGTLEPYGFLGVFRPFSKVQFLAQHVLHMVPEIPDQIEKQYLQATTGIQIASA